MPGYLEKEFDEWIDNKLKEIERLNEELYWKRKRNEKYSSIVNFFYIVIILAIFITLGLSS